jgi:hypothetical protein
MASAIAAYDQPFLIDGAFARKALFVCFHDGWLLFYRSWTGFCIYGLRLDTTLEGTQIRESWVNRDREQYGCTDIDDGRKLDRHLIDELLLNRRASLPASGCTQDPWGLFQVAQKNLQLECLGLAEPQAFQVVINR